MRVECRAIFRGAPLFFVLLVDMATGQIEVLVTNAALIDWSRGQGRFLNAANNYVGRAYIAPHAYRLGAVLNQQNVPHIGANAASPRTSAMFLLPLANFIRLLIMI